jgi:hypothetical protein
MYHPQPPLKRVAQSMKAVFWAYFGIRRSQGLEEDATQLSPLYVALGTVLVTLLLIGTLISIVHAFLI